MFGQISESIKTLDKLFSSKKNFKKDIKSKINFMGKKILKDTLKEINVFL